MNRSPLRCYCDIPRPVAVAIGALVWSIVHRLNAVDRFERLGLALNENLPAEIPGWLLGVLALRHLLADRRGFVLLAKFERDLSAIVGGDTLAYTQRQMAAWGVVHPRSGAPSQSEPSPATGATR